MKKVVVNSFPRTGNVFLTSIMHEYFYKNALDKSIDNMTNTILHDIQLLENVDVPQISILRDPMEAIVSNKIYVEHNLGIDYSLEKSAREWMDWHISIYRNMGHIYPLKFTQLTNKTKECLGYIKETFDLDSCSDIDTSKFSNHLAKKDNVRATSKTSNQYDQVRSEFLQIPKEILEDIEYLYGLLVSKLNDRQIKLGWIF